MISGSCDTEDLSNAAEILKCIWNVFEIVIIFYNTAVFTLFLIK